MAPKATAPFSLTACKSLATILHLASILLILNHAGIGDAAIFSCQSGETIVYQDRPCPLKKTAVTATKAVPGYPLSIHESWFDLPEQAEDRAFCDKRGCECGRIEKSHQGSLVQAVADSLFLDGSWHRYETSVQRWMASSSAEGFVLREQMLEASCEVMMSQTLLRNYADDVMNILKARSRTAEERGFDSKLPCEQGIPDACALYDSVQLLSRIREDAFLLRRIRGQNALPEDKP